MQPTTTIGLRILRQAGEFLVRRLDEYALNTRTEGTISKDIVDDIGPFSASKVLEQLSQAYPKHSVIGQFTSAHHPKDGDKAHEWAFELWDNLVLFHNGYPSNVLSLGHSVNSKSLDAVVYNPRTAEEFSASAGHGAELNGKRIRCSLQRNLNRSVIGIDWLSQSKIFEGSPWMKRLQRLAGESYKFLDNGSSLYMLAQVASGHLDGAILTHLTPQQWAIGKLLLQESGALVCNINGDPKISPNDAIVMANPKLMKALVKAMVEPTTV